jgi:diaminopimelate decarboxylase
MKARVALRVNPDVETDTHAHISTGRLAHKFGVDIGEAEAVYQRARRHENLSVEGVSCHIGSQLMDPGPVMEAVDRVLEFIERLRAHGIQIRHADLGGGLGVAYKPGEVTPAIADFVSALRGRLMGRGLQVMIEPGRSIVGGAGVLLTRVLYRKKTGEKEFVIVDAAMNDLIRPVLYGAYHDILPLRDRNGAKSKVDVVGPVCETGDFCRTCCQETCWRCVPPAPTDSSRRPTITPVRAPRRCWWKAARGEWCVSAKATRI